MTGPTTRDAPPPSGGGVRRDDVDDVVASWHRERPDLDLGPLEVLSRVTRLARHLDLARRTAFEAHGLETWEFDVLAALRRAGEPHALSPGRLLAATLVSSGTMTHRVQRLTTRGLVERSPDPSDGRGVVVALTADGSALVDAAMTDLLAHEHQILATLGGDDREQLARLLKRVVLPFEAAGA